MSENAYAQRCLNCGADYPNADNYVHTCPTNAFVQPVLVGVEKTAAVSMVETIARLERKNVELGRQLAAIGETLMDAQSRRFLAEADLAAARAEVQRWADLMTTREQERAAARAGARVLREALWEVLDSLGALGGSWWELDGLANARAKEICALAAVKEANE